MKLLIVKTSSFGDILHAFPALTDAWRSVEGLVCDWLVEAPYATMPGWHPAVRRAIPVSLRSWRRFPWLNHAPVIRRSVRDLRREHYDLILDAQGLAKSAVVAAAARGRRAGPSRASAREPLAARLYHEPVDVAPGRHAIDQNRELFAGALGYAIPQELAYGLRLPDSDAAVAGAPYLVFLPGTTWSSKRWPVRYWRILAELADEAGWPVQVLAGSAGERQVAQCIAAGLRHIEVSPSLSIDALAGVLHGARAAVSMDSGPGHLAAAVGTPGVSIYGATDPALTGTRGAGQVHLAADFVCAPCRRRRCQFADTGQIHPDCYATVPPARVWRTLHELIEEQALA